MTRDQFSEHLRQSTLRSHELALMCVENDLKPPFTFLVKLNQSYDGNPPAGGEVIPKEIRAKGNSTIGPLSHDEVVSLLWLDGLVPEWVDIIPWEATSGGLTFQLTCCGRFAEEVPLLYHQQEGFPPFHAPGVWMPFEWKSVEENGRLNLNWHFSLKSKR